MRAANEKMERETAADPESANIECLSDPEAPHIAMDLACGLLEVKPADEHAAADSDDDDDDGAPLQLPSQQTRAVADAVKAGRTLISEVAEGGEGGEDGDPPPPAGWKRKATLTTATTRPPQNWRRAAPARRRRRGRRGARGGRRRQLENFRHEFPCDLGPDRETAERGRNDGRRKGGCRHARRRDGAGAARLAAGRALARATAA